MTAGRMLLKSRVIIALLSPALAFAATAKIEKLGQGSVVKVARAGTVLKLKEGDSLESGDELTTDATTSVDLRLEDETLIRIGVNSSYRVQTDSKLHSLVHRLISGAVRVLVKPTEGDKKEAAAIKFRMNTPEGTIGVRGTEFVVLSNAGKTEVKGLDGEVVFGPVDADFGKPGSYVMVSRGFASFIKSGAKSAERPAKFDLKSYIDELGKKDGIFGPLAARVSGGNNKHARAASPAASAHAPAVAAAPAIAKWQPAEKKEAKKDGAPTKVDYQAMLLLAAQEGDVKAAEKALKGGAQINGKGAVGHTALQIAMLNDKEEMFIFLIKRGANVEAEDDNGHTPLMFVAQNSLDIAYAKALVYPGAADLEKKDKGGQGALDMAKKSGHKELADYLESKEALEDLDKALSEKAAKLKK